MNKYEGQYIEVFSEGRRYIIISKHITYIDKKNAKLYMSDGNIKCPESLPDFVLKKHFSFQMAIL